jgi:hypothetical protein
MLSIRAGSMKRPLDYVRIQGKRQRHGRSPPVDVPNKNQEIRSSPATNITKA